ncbi:MAG: hypothetical protein ACTHNS_16265 [Marmoricola sp.]
MPQRPTPQGAREPADQLAAEPPTCRRGHELTEANLHTTAAGKQTCRECLDLANASRRDRRRRASEAKAARRAAEAAAEEKARRRFVLPPAGVGTVGVVGGRVVRGEDAARARLAAMVRQGRT